MEANSEKVVVRSTRVIIAPLVGGGRTARPCSMRERPKRPTGNGEAPRTPAMARRQQRVRLFADGGAWEFF